MTEQMTADQMTAYAIVTALLAFSHDHPWCVYGLDAHRRYSDGYRDFILDLAEQYEDLPLHDFADACLLPLPILKNWLQGERSQVQPELTYRPSSDPCAPRQVAVYACPNGHRRLDSGNGGRCPDCGRVLDLAEWLDELDPAKP